MDSQESTSTDDTNTRSASPLIPDGLDGRWGPIRLFREASLDNDQAALEWSRQFGLLKENKECRRDRIQMRLRFRRDHYEWYCYRCGTKTTAMQDSIFEDSRLSPGKTLMLAYCFASGCSYEETKKNLIFEATDEPTANTTIASYFSLFRESITAKYERISPRSDKIGGPGKIVQVDEAVLGRRKYHRGRVYDLQWVCMIDQDGNVRMEICPNRTRESLHYIIRKHVRSGSIIHSDGWRAYQYCWASQSVANWHFSRRSEHYHRIDDGTNNFRL